MRLHRDQILHADGMKISGPLTKTREDTVTGVDLVGGEVEQLEIWIKGVLLPQLPERRAVASYHTG